MPIPTDTFWNIRRLNVVFALSSLALVAVCGWAIKQDYEKTWRPLQKEGFVWDAALTEQRINHLDTKEVEARHRQLDDQIAATKSRLEQKDIEYQQAIRGVKDAESQISNISFEYNNRKATVGVMESLLQDARTRADAAQVEKLTRELQDPERKLSVQGEKLAALKDSLGESRKKAKARANELEDLKKEQKKLYDDIAALKKRETTLAPDTFLAKLSDNIRNAPLLGFMNPSLRVKPTFIPDVRMDVSFATIDTIDRCATCHTHIDNKNFTREKVYGFLEEQAAGYREYKYADFAETNPKYKPTDPTTVRPLATAMPEFWHYWGRRLLAPASFDKARAKMNGIFNAIAKMPEVTYEGKPVGLIKFPTTALSTFSAAEQAKYDAIFVAAVNALYRREPGDTTVTVGRNLALAYPVQIQQLLKAELPADQYRQLEERYRHALVAEINPSRVKKGFKPLDPSPVHLAHPKLELYVDVDSKHPMEQHGCTSCHDGSGNETDFVLVAHSPRAIWVDDKTGEPVLPAQIKKPAKAAPAHGEKDHHAAELSTMDNMLDAVYPANASIPSAVSSLHLQLNGEASETHSIVGREQAREEVEATAPATEYVNPVTGKTGKAVPQARYWSNKYEAESGTSFESVNEMWDWPMRPPELIQANCARCHNNFHDIKDEAPILYEGRSLFNKVGCSNCHQMDSIAADEFEAKNTLADGTVETVRRRAGTDLRHVPAKLSKDFVSSWIWAPKAFRPSTLMPHFFMLENSSSDEEIRRTRQEVKAITEYLFAAASPMAPKHAVPTQLKGDVEKGRDIFQNIGCQGCHTNLNETGEKWITTDLVKRYNFKAADAAKKYEEMTYNERQVYALENLGEVTSTGNDQKKYADGTAMPVFMHHAPELSGIGDKLTAGRTPEQARAWLFDWLKEPRHYSAYTVMPRLRLSDQQATDLMEYLLAQKRATTAPKGKSSEEFDGWQASAIPADDKKISELVAWFLRSQFSPHTADAKAVDDAEMTTRAIDALAYVSTATDDARPTDEAKAKVDARAAAKDRVGKMSLQEKQLIFLGNKLIAHYGCMNCHAINGMEAVASPCANLSDWGQKQVSKLDFGFLDEHKVHSLPEQRSIPMVNGLSAAAVTEIAKIVDHKDWKTPVAANVQVGWPRIEHERADWLTHKILNSRVYDRGKNSLDPVRKMKDGKPVVDDKGYPVLDEMAGQELRGKPYDKLKMPTFYLNEEQAHAIVTFVVSNRTRWISDKLIATTNNDLLKRIAHGRQIAERYNCVGCHQTELNFPPVRQYYPSDQWTALAPPSLRGEGNKIQHSWLFGFLKNVELIRPALFMRPVYEAGKEGIRMPSFPITDEEATAVAEYFSSVSVHEAKDLKQKLDTVIKYVDTQRKATTQPLADPQKPWPGDDWVDKEINSTAREYLKTWVLDRKLMVEAAFDPVKTPKPDDMRARYREALYDARFLMGLYDAPYPFVENAQMDMSNVQASGERFKQGEALFYEMQCMKCHYVGDINAPGANTKPTAPNLSNVHRRLQRRWTTHWVQEPPLIQVGTLMPAFFSGLSAFKLDGLPWPLGTASLQDDADKIKQFTTDTDKVLAKYGVKDVREQKALLLDYVYATGLKPGYSAAQPADAVPAGGGGATTAPAGGPTTKPAEAKPN
jgi:cytochrome c551/c552